MSNYEPGHYYCKRKRDFLINMAETQKVFAILISVICQHYIMDSFKYCDAKFGHRVYKESVHEYRSPSVVALNANCTRKTARQEVSQKKAILEQGISLKCQYIMFDMSASDIFSAVRAVLYSN